LAGVSALMKALPAETKSARKDRKVVSKKTAKRGRPARRKVKA
jgi:hypothetical protein